MDLFPSAERAKWTGLLNLPTGIAATIGPTLGGLITESAWGWRGLFWGAAPLILIAGVLVAIGAPGRAEKIKQKIDVLGTIMMVLAASSLIIGFSWLGDPARRVIGAILLVISTAAWTGFVVVEKKAAAPILDPQILKNRTFLTAAGAGLLSFFGRLGIGAYSPIFTQDVMGVSPTISGSMLTPFSIILAVMGILAEFLAGKNQEV